MARTDKKSKSVYAPGPKDQAVERHTLAVLVNNEPGVLARVVGLFSGRGYNIDSLTVTEINHARHLSRITVVCSGTPHVIEQIIAQLERLVPVLKVNDLTSHGDCFFRELALVRVRACTEKEIEKTGALQKFDAHVLEIGDGFSILEATGAAEDIDKFIEAIEPLQIINVARTGVAGIARTKKSLEEQLDKKAP